MPEVYEWNDRHSKLLTLFFQQMNQEQIPFFVLRNYEGLPETNTSKDVDIIVKPERYLKAKEILLDTFRKCRLSHYYQMNFERAHCFYGMNLNCHFAIHIDLIAGYANKGFEILTFDYLYKNTITYKDFKVLKSSLDVVMLLLYKVIGCKELKEKYRQTIKTTYLKESSEIRNILQNVLGEKLGYTVEQYIRENEYEKIVFLADNIGFTAKRRVLLKNPMKTIGGIVSFLSEKVWRIIICPAKFQKFIAVEAPDGTGKTTFINTLTIQIAHCFVTDITKSRVHHFRPCILPNLGAIGEKTGMMKQDTNFTVPHRAKPAGFISSFCRLIYYWTDYLIGIQLILRKNAQFDKITIFDRYIYDLIVDPYRTCIKLPLRMRWMFAKMVKQPKIVFVLDADADTIYARKQELDKVEINRQLVEFRKLKALGGKVHILDASKTPQQIAEDAMKIIVDEFTNKL